MSVLRTKLLFLFRKAFTESLSGSLEDQSEYICLSKQVEISSNKVI